ncbi:ResB family protein, partial [Dietzia cinnamea P4]
ESGALERRARVNLMPGESTTLPDGTEVRFDGADEFINIQVSEDPTQIWVGVFAAVMVGGLVLSLMVRRRRIWARIIVDEAQATRVDLGGLAKTDRSGWGREFDDLRDRLATIATATPVLPEPSDTASSRGDDPDASWKDNIR